MKTFLIAVMAFFMALPLVSQEASFSTFTGKIITYEELIQAPQTVLFVWTTWCPYCRRELNRLIKSGLLKDPDMAYYFINIGERRTAIERFASRQKLPDEVRQKIILDEREILAEKFSVVGIPMYIFLKNSKPVEQSYFLDEKILNSVYGDE